MQAAYIQISIHWKYIGTAEKVTNNRTDLKISAFLSIYDKLAEYPASPGFCISWCKVSVIVISKL